MPKRCLGCQRRTHTGSYCRQCWHQRRKIRTGWDWGVIRAQVHARDRDCARCGGIDGLQVHHRVTLVDGGSNAPGNLELRCRNCHTEAHRECG
jgi:5-methylcytosine-specific restriction endonuclease McrA